MLHEAISEFTNMGAPIYVTKAEELLERVLANSD
jgi:hypothetical protein